MKRKVFIALFVIMFGLGLASCVEITSPEEVESIELNFDVKDFYELGDTTSDDVQLAGKSVTVNLDGGDPFTVTLPDDRIELSGDGILANSLPNDPQLNTAKINKYNVYITYEDSTVHLQYIVEDFELLAMINDKTNYFDDDDKAKLDDSFFVDNYANLDKWNLLIYWDYVGTYVEGATEPGTIDNKPTTPYNPTVNGVEVKVNTVAGSATFQNTTGNHLLATKGLTTREDFDTTPPWDSSYEFVSFMRETIQYRGMNKRANQAVAEIGWGAREVIDLDLLLGDLYKIMQGFQYKTQIDGLSLDVHLSYYSTLLYGGTLDREIWGVPVYMENFKGLYQLNAVELLDYSNRIASIADVNGYAPSTVELLIERTYVFDQANDIRWSSSFRTTLELDGKGMGLYTYIWMAALDVNGIDAATRNAIIAGIDSQVSSGTSYCREWVEPDPYPRTTWPYDSTPS